MNFGVTGEVLFVGGRERAMRLAEMVDDCLVRWATTPAVAVALVEGGSHQFDCIVADLDDTSVFDAARERWADVTCLSIVGAGPDAGEPVRDEDLARHVAGAVDGGRDYPVPLGEADRLAETEAYLRETIVDANGFDRLAALARRLFEADVGFVGLLDDHSEHIVGVDGEFPETLPRKDSICTHTILDDGPLVVDDVAHDPRFEDNERLERLGVRAYAGVPIHSRTGERIGSICVTDCIPRAFSEGDLEKLQLLAEQAADQFELQRRMADEEPLCV